MDSVTNQGSLAEEEMTFSPGHAATGTTTISDDDDDMQHHRSAQQIERTSV
jgi:hypothetical protein